MDKKYKAYTSFKFFENENWRIYYNNLLPTPSLQQLEKYKKRFYKQHIDKDFDISFTPAREEENAGGRGRQGEQSPERGHEYERGSTPGSIDFLFHSLSIAALPISYLLQLPYISLYTALPMFFVILYRMFRIYGFIKFNMMYWQYVLASDYFHNLLFLFISLLAGNATCLVKIPLFMFSLSEIALCLYKWRIYNLFPFRAINAKRAEFLEVKTDIEIYLGFYFIAILPLGWISFILPLFYWQIMQVRYTLNGSTRCGFMKLGLRLDRIAANPKCPSVAAFLIRKLRALGNYLSTMNQPQEGQQPQRRCNIF